MSSMSQFGSVLTPTRYSSQKKKSSTSFQLTIRNRLGAALKFASACDGQKELGITSITPSIHTNPKIPCPLCCQRTLPAEVFSNVLPSENDDSASAHYMFCCRPSSKQLLHWQTQQCYLCQGLLVKGDINRSIVVANETYRKIERHRCRRALNIDEHDQLIHVVETWRKFSIIENGSGTLSDTSKPSGQEEALSSLNLAHAYFNGLGVIAQNIDLCIQHTKRAAKLGLSAAKYNLGLLFLWGHLQGGEADAVYYFRKAAQDGYVAARYQLALLVRDGVSSAVKDDRKYHTDVSEEEAKSRISSSSQSSKNRSKSTQKRKQSKSELNRSRALHSLLNLVILGFRTACLDAACLLARGTQCNFTSQLGALGLKRSANMWHRAFVIWCKGAALGCQVCTHHIATCYKTGLGVSRSLPLAVQCYSKAAAMGHLASMTELHALQQDLPEGFSHSEHFYANKWAAMQKAVEKKRQSEDRSQSHQSVGGEGVERHGIVGTTSELHHRYHHHQREWQPWYSHQQSSNLLETLSSSPDPLENQWVDVASSLRRRNKTLQRQTTSQRPDHFTFKHSKVLDEDREEQTTIEDQDTAKAKTLYDGVERRSGGYMFETQSRPPKGSYQENFQRAFDVIT